ncbi:MAG: cytochrome P460 family protein [Myxococcota bacterium]|nr:cytochrome P460 family protein [Myxococcota bacterium]
MSARGLGLIAALAIGAGACAESVDPDIVERYPIDGYQAWKRVDVRGNAPGHTNSYRVIYADPTAADPAQDFRLGYQEGSIFVKEVRDDVDGQPGDLRYLAIMRRVGPVTAALEDDGGWLYTETSTPGEPEQHFDFCWNRCHVAAPYNGAFYDYRQ